MSLRRDEVVPREPFVEAFRRSGLTAGELALRMGYIRNRRNRPGTIGDASRLLRVLGLKHETNEGVTRIRTGPMNYDLAVRLCEALDLDFVDMDV